MSAAGGGGGAWACRLGFLVRRAQAHGLGSTPFPGGLGSLASIGLAPSGRALLPCALRRRPVLLRRGSAASLLPALYLPAVCLYWCALIPPPGSNVFRVAAGRCAGALRCASLALAPAGITHECVFLRPRTLKQRR